MTKVLGTVDVAGIVSTPYRVAALRMTPPEGMSPSVMTTSSLPMNYSGRDEHSVGPSDSAWWGVERGGYRVARDVCLMALRV